MGKEVSPAALLDRFVERNQDRSLFGLPPKPSAGADRSPPVASAPLEGWRPIPLSDGSPGSLYAGPNPTAPPKNLFGLTITARARRGKSWNATISEIMEQLTHIFLTFFTFRQPDRLIDQAGDTGHLGDTLRIVTPSRPFGLSFCGP